MSIILQLCIYQTLCIVICGTDNLKNELVNTTEGVDFEPYASVTLPNSIEKKYTEQNTISFKKKYQRVQTLLKMLKDNYGRSDMPLSDYLSISDQNRKIREELSSLKISLWYLHTYAINDECLQQQYYEICNAITSAEEELRQVK